MSVVPADAARAVSTALPPDFSADLNVSVLAKEGETVETSVAVSPADPDRIVVGAMGSGGRVVTCDAYLSRDGGRTWAPRVQLGLTASDGSVWQWHSDPVVVADRRGVFHYATLMIKSQNGLKIGIAVARSEDGGESWSAPVMVSHPINTSSDDKQWMAVDTSGGPHDGNLYLLWGRYDASMPSGASGRIVFARSTDGGRTWGEPMPLTDFSGVGMSQIAVGPGGEVYAMYNERGFRFRVSRDGGLTFSEPVNMGGVGNGPGGTIPNTLAQFSPMQTLAVDLSNGPYRGRIYVAQPGRTTNPTAGAVAFRWSDDHGTTWSAPQIISGDTKGRDAMFMTLAVDRVFGDVVVSWLDRRDDPANTLARVYATRSTDGGITFTTPRAFSSPFDISREFFGHYHGLAADSGRWVTAFSTGGGHMSAARLDFGQPEPKKTPPVRRRSIR